MQRHIAAAIVTWGRQDPERLAIIVPDGGSSGEQFYTRTYGELLAGAQKVAAIVRRLTKDKPCNCEKVAGLNPAVQDTIRVGLLLPNSPEFLEIFLGVTLAGGVAMVFDPKWSLSQVQQVIRRSAPDLLLVTAEWEAQMRGVFAEIPCMRVPQWREGLDQDSLELENWEAKRKFSIVSDHAPFYVGFTSGTTGVPKGVVRSHRSWIKSFTASRAEFGTCADDRILVPGSLTHSLSLYTALECLNAGATLYLLPKFSAKAVLRLLDSQSVTVLVAVPALLKPIVRPVILQSLACPGLRAVIAGGSKLDFSLRSNLPLAFPKAEILEYFGALELSFISLATSRDAAPPDSVGRSFQGVELSVRRLNGQGEAAVGEVGWVGVKSQMLSLGYLEQSSEPIPSSYRTVDGWATVGDLGWRDVEGFLYLVGREQEMILSGGMNIYPTEIEAALCNLPEVADAVVVGVPDGDRGEVVGAAIRWVGTALSRSALLHRLQTYLPSAKCPRYVITVDQFPTTSTGKVQRSAVRQHLIDRLLLSQS